MSAEGEAAPAPRLTRATSGLRHLRWGREVLATLEAHIEHNTTLDEGAREALRDEARALAGAVQALSGAVKPYRDFLERTRVHARGRVRMAELLLRESDGDEAARCRAEERVDAARAALAALEASQRRPLKAALTAAIDALRAAMEQMDGRVGRRLSAAFVESLHPPLAREDTRVADDGDPDDDATAAAGGGTLVAGAAREIQNPLAFVITNIDAAIRRVGHLEQRSGASRGASWGRASAAARGPSPELAEALLLLEDAREGAERVRLIVRDTQTGPRPEVTPPASADEAAEDDARDDDDDARAMKTAPRTSSRPPKADARATPRRRILVIDDEPMLARAIAGTLEPRYETTTTSSARDALDRIRGGERYDVLLCDLMMPGMTGMDLHRSLGDVAPEQQRRMVFLTGGAFTERGREFLEQVSARLLVKPFDAATLLALVDEVTAPP